MLNYKHKKSITMAFRKNRLIFSDNNIHYTHNLNNDSILYISIDNISLNSL